MTASCVCGPSVCKAGDLCNPQLSDGCAPPVCSVTNGGVSANYPCTCFGTDCTSCEVRKPSMFGASCVRPEELESSSCGESAPFPGGFQGAWAAGPKEKATSGRPSMLATAFMSAAATAALAAVAACVVATVRGRNRTAARSAVAAEGDRALLSAGAEEPAMLA